LPLSLILLSPVLEEKGLLTAIAGKFYWVKWCCPDSESTVAVMFFREYHVWIIGIEEPTQFIIDRLIMGNKRTRFYHAPKSLNIFFF